jgi:citrate lyase subunit beta/citryl-CoA lyase
MVIDLGLIRSALFVPGNRSDRVPKALGTAADVVIIDLEDAVPLTEKARTRQEVAQVLAETHEKKVFVRVNGVDTDFFSDDLMAVACEGLAGLIIPKVQSVDDVKVINWSLLQVEKNKGLDPGRLSVIALIETARAVDNISQITMTKTDPARLYSVAFGAADYTQDMGIEITREGSELLYARSRLPIACRAAGLQPPLDTPFMVDLKDIAALETDAARARQLGFQGKLCIHPNQIEPVNRIFSPSPEEILKARHVIEAFEEAEARGQGALQVDGKFVDYPVVKRARRILKMAAMLQDI